MDLPHIFEERYEEIRNTDAGSVAPNLHAKILQPGAENCLSFEVLEEGTNLDGIAYTWGFTGAEEIEADQHFTYELGLYWLPMYNEDAQRAIEVPLLAAATDSARDRALKDEVKKIWDRVWPKTDNLDTDNLGDFWTPTHSDLEIGDVDTALAYQPGKLPLEMLHSPEKPARLFHRRVWGGWIHGNCFRTGNGTKVRYQERLKGMIRRGINANRPGYLAWIITIPNDIPAGDFDDPQTRLPRSRRFENARYRCPAISKVAGVPTIWPSTEDDFLRNATQWRTDGERQMVQQKLDTFTFLRYHYDRRTGEVRMAESSPAPEPQG